MCKCSQFINADTMLWSSVKTTGCTPQGTTFPSCIWTVVTLFVTTGCISFKWLVQPLLTSQEDSLLCACTWIYAFLIQNVSRGGASSTATGSGIPHSVTLTVPSDAQIHNVFWHIHRHNLWQMLYVGCSGEGQEELEFHCHNSNCLLQTAHRKYKYDSIVERTQHSETSVSTAEPANKLQSNTRLL